MRYFCGIDPGYSGAIAVIDTVRSSDSFVTDMPTLDIMVGKKAKKALNLRALREIFVPYTATELVVCVEDVHAFPKQGVVSSFNFGLTYGSVLGIIAALGFVYIKVSPVRWKKVMMTDMGKEKEASVVKAVELFPSFARCLQVPNNRGKFTSYDGRADALLLAEYGRQVYAKEIK